LPLLIAGLAAALIHIIFESPLWLALASKLVPVICLMIWVAPKRDPYSRLISAGLSLSLLGDALLGLPGDLFLPGLAAFLLAHLCYIAAFLTKERRGHWLRLLPVVIWLGSVFAVIHPGLGAMTLPVAAYCLVIGTMMWRAWSLPGLAAGLGAAAFGVSDSLLAIMRFHGTIAGGGILLILAYWAGQYGLARSAHDQ